MTVTWFVFLDRHLLLCCSRDDTLRLIDLRQNSITATFRSGGKIKLGVWAQVRFVSGSFVHSGGQIQCKGVEFVGGGMFWSGCHIHIHVVEVRRVGSCC